MALHHVIWSSGDAAPLLHAVGAAMALGCAVGTSQSMVALQYLSGLRGAGGGLRLLGAAATLCDAAAYGLLATSEPWHAKEAISHREAKSAVLRLVATLQRKVQAVKRGQMGRGRCVGGCSQGQSLTLS